MFSREMTHLPDTRPPCIALPPESTKVDEPKRITSSIRQDFIPKEVKRLVASSSLLEMEPDRRAANDAVDESDEGRRKKTTSKTKTGRNTTPASIHTPRGRLAANDDETTNNASGGSMPWPSNDAGRRMIADVHGAQSAYMRRLQDERLFHRERGRRWHRPPVVGTTSGNEIGGHRPRPPHSSSTTPSRSSSNPTTTAAPTLHRRSLESDDLFAVRGGESSSTAAATSSPSSSSTRVRRDNGKNEGGDDDDEEEEERAVPIGNVGYTFRKEFDAGWFVGTVIKIMSDGDRRCEYTDGDIEDLYLSDLIHLAELDPENDDGNDNDSSTTTEEGFDVDADVIATIPTTLPPMAAAVITTTTKSMLDVICDAALTRIDTVEEVYDAKSEDITIDTTSGRLVVKGAANNDNNAMKEGDEEEVGQERSSTHKTATSCPFTAGSSYSSYLAQNHQPPTLPPIFPITKISSSLSSSTTVKDSVAPTTTTTTARGGGTTVFIPPVIHGKQPRIYPHIWSSQREDRDDLPRPIPPPPTSATSPHNHGHVNHYHHHSMMMMMPPSLPPYSMMLPPLPPPPLPRSGISSTSDSSSMIVGQTQMHHPTMMQMMMAQQQQQQQQQQMIIMNQQHPGGGVPHIVDLSIARMQQHQQQQPVASTLHGAAAAAAAYNMGLRYYHQHQHDMARGSRQQQQQQQQQQHQFFFPEQHVNLNPNEYDTTEEDTERHEQQRHHKRHRSSDSTTTEARDESTLPPLPPLEHHRGKKHEDDDVAAADAATGV